MDPFDLARKAYDSYGSVTEYKNFRGEPMPSFDDLPQTIKEAWRAAASRVEIEIKHEITKKNWGFKF